MTRELDEAWVQEAIARHRRTEQWQAEFDSWVGAAEVSVHSPDELVEVLVCTDGSIRSVRVGPLQGRTDVEVSRSVDAAVGAAAAAADWARRTLYAETLRGALPEQAPADPLAPPTPGGEHQQPSHDREQHAGAREEPDRRRAGHR